MELIDTHAHLTSAGLIDRIEDVLAAARAADVRQIVTIASDANDAECGVEIARTHPMVFATAGIHPHEAAKTGPRDLERVAELLAESKTVALGEIGLDYFYDFAEPDAQKRVFTSQLEMARECDLPLIIHCREAFDDCISLLEACGYRNKRVVVHCFTGTAEEAQRVAERGWRISFTGIVTFKKSAALQAIAQAYPADQLMLETDAPYLSPMPVRHVRPNEPAHVRHTAAFLADLRGVPFDELACQTTGNARAFFGLPTPDLD